MDKKQIRLILLMIILAVLLGGAFYFKFYNFDQKENQVKTEQPKEKISFQGCPTGYVTVKKNSNNEFFFNKASSILSGKDYFCVMSYEARCDMNGDNIGDYPQENGLPRGQSFNWSDCNKKSVASSAEGVPLVNITQESAKDVCSSFGEGYHLITNDEWMAIARDVENIQQNWVENVLPRGNSSNDYVTSSVDNSPYSINSRYFYLSNGDMVWDMAGNVWEWTNDVIKQKDQPPYNGWYEVNQLSDYGLVGKENIVSSNLNYTSANGIGKLFLNYYPDNDADRVLLRGGSWGDEDRAGIYTLDFLNSPNDFHEYIGFRCAKVY